VLIFYLNLVKPERASQKHTESIVEKIQAGAGDLTERVPVPKRQSKKLMTGTGTLCITL